MENRESTIQSGDMVLLRLPNGDVRAVKVEKDQYVVFLSSQTKYKLIEVQNSHYWKARLIFCE
jgi:hypothetical protein